MQDFQFRWTATSAGPADDVGRLFAWMTQGDTELTMSTGDQDIALEVSPASAEMFEEMMRSTGAIVSGRRMFDVASAWGGRHPWAHRSL